MKTTRKSRKTSNGNKHNIETVTRENPLLPVKLSPTNDRLNLRIPKKAKLYKYLTVDNSHDDSPLWKQTDAILLAAQHNKEVFTAKIYDVFIKAVGVFYPDKIEKLNKLRPMILRHILTGDKLDESSYKDLKEL
jgi:hypothetical protein